jgi:GNAT superfamily N-acetyltransferase
MPHTEAAAPRQLADGTLIRPAVAADLDAIIGLIRELAEYEKLLEAVTLEPQVLHAQLFGDTPAAEVVILEKDGATIGMALFFHNFSTFLGRRGLYLEDLYVQPAQRGHGYGKALMVYLARLAVARGCGRFEWSVLDWNEPAIRFYRTLGAEPQEEWTVQRISGEALQALAAEAG